MRLTQALAQKLRLIHVADVYQLHNLPRLATLVKRCGARSSPRRAPAGSPPAPCSWSRWGKGGARPQDTDFLDPNVFGGTHLFSDTPPDAVVVSVGGDFVAPSLLSTVDYGAGMVECLRLMGTTHCTLGNHETDIPHGELLARLDELGAVVVNSNVPQLPGLEDVPEVEVVEVVDSETACALRPSCPPHGAAGSRGGRRRRGIGGGWRWRAC